MKDEPTQEAVTGAWQQVWTSFLEGNICASLLIKRADLPRDRETMRALIAARLAQLGDALLAEWDRQLWDEEE